MPPMPSSLRISYRPPRTSPSWKMVAPILEKMGWTAEPEVPGEAGLTMVRSSEAALASGEGVGGRAMFSEAISLPLLPEPAASSGLGTGRGRAAELSPLETAAPCCARCAAASRSPAIPAKPRGRTPCERHRLPHEVAYRCEEYTLIRRA